MNDLKAYSAARIFTGEEWLPEHAVLVKQDQILALPRIADLPADIYLENFPGSLIAPAFIDLQIYGAKNKLLSAYPEADALARLSQHCAEGGTAFCMPTVATNTKELFFRCMDAVRDYWNQGGGGILGLHLEGPWINSIKRGAHLASLIHSPSLEEVREILEYGRGVIKIITLAPECCSEEVIDLIQSEGIIISAGHSNATYQQAMKSFEKIPAVTHLYNAMSPLQHREPGLVGATMDHPTVHASIIPDGIHVDFAALRIASQVMKERLFIITDAVTETTIGDYQHQLEGDRYTSSGILSGSALTMTMAVRNLVAHGGIELGEALRMCSLYPARVVKMDDQLGHLAKNKAAKLVILDQQLNFSRLIS